MSLELAVTSCVRVFLMIKKALVFRVYSFILTLIASRLWFGDWHMTPFAVFLIPYCTVIYYVFEKMWRGYERD